MQVNKEVVFKRQRGISLTALIFAIAVLGLFAVLVMKITPSYIEYRAVSDGIKRAKQAGGTASEMRTTFDKFAEINNVEAVRGRDLVIKADSATPELSFAYEKHIPLTDKATLVIDYEGTTDPSGVVEAGAD